MTTGDNMNCAKFGALVACCFLISSPPLTPHSAAQLQIGRELKALGVRNVRSAIISHSGHWNAEEQRSLTAGLIATFAESIFAKATRS